MNIIQIQKAINEFQKLPNIKYENNQFDVGPCDHLKNLTTDVLSFFCDGSEEHKMGNLIVDSMTFLLNEQYRLDIPRCKFSAVSDNKIATETGGRIDLVIESGECIFVMKVQIGDQHKTLCKEDDSNIDKLINEHDKRVIYLILSSQHSLDLHTGNRRWVNISFNQLAQKIIVNLQQHFFGKPFNTWLPIFKDFLLHMENLMNEQKHAEFALQNMADISSAWQLLTETLRKVDAHVQSSVSSSTQHPLICRKHSWFPPLPAYVYQFQDSQITVILFASTDAIDMEKAGNNDANIGKHLFIQVHVDIRFSKELYQRILNALSDKVVNYWEDANMGYLRWPTSESSFQYIVDDIITTLAAIHSEEQSELQG